MMLNISFQFFSLVVLCGLVCTSSVFADRDPQKGWDAVRVLENPNAAEKARVEALTTAAANLPASELQTNVLLLLIERSTPAELRESLFSFFQFLPKGDPSFALEFEKYLHVLLQDPESSPTEIRQTAMLLELSVRHASKQLNQFEFLVALFRDFGLSASRRANFPMTAEGETAPRREMRLTIESLLKALSVYEGRVGLLHQGTALIAGHPEYQKQLPTFTGYYMGKQSPEMGYAAAVVCSTLIPPGHGKKNTVDGWLKSERPAYITAATAGISEPPATPPEKTVAAPAAIAPSKVVPPPTVKRAAVPPPVKAATPALPIPAPKPISTPVVNAPQTPAPTPAPNLVNVSPAVAPSPPEPEPEPKDPVRESLDALLTADSDLSRKQTIDELAAGLAGNESLQVEFVGLLMDERLSPEIRNHAADCLGAAKDVTWSTRDLLNQLYRHEPRDSVSYVLAEKLLIVLGELTIPEFDEVKPPEEASGPESETAPAPEKTDSEIEVGTGETAVVESGPPAAVAETPKIAAPSPREKRRNERRPKPALAARPSAAKPAPSAPDVPVVADASNESKPKNLREQLLKDFVSPANNFGFRLACGLQLFRLTDREKLSIDEIYEVAMVFKDVDMRRSHHASGVSFEEIEFRRIAAQLILNSRRTLLDFPPKDARTSVVSNIIIDCAQSPDPEFRSGFGLLKGFLPGRSRFLRPIDSGTDLLVWVDSIFRAPWRAFRGHDIDSNTIAEFQQECARGVKALGRRALRNLQRGQK